MESFSRLVSVECQTPFTHSYFDIHKCEISRENRLATSFHFSLSLVVVVCLALSGRRDVSEK